MRKKMPVKFLCIRMTYIVDCDGAEKEVFKEGGATIVK
jgi:hypothetical protein